jgi:hypothetical protein
VGTREKEKDLIDAHAVRSPARRPAWRARRRSLEWEGGEPCRSDVIKLEPPVRERCGRAGPLLLFRHSLVRHPTPAFPSFSRSFPFSPLTSSSSSPSFFLPRRSVLSPLSLLFFPAARLQQATQIVNFGLPADGASCRSVFSPAGVGGGTLDLSHGFDQSQRRGCLRSDVAVPDLAE